eukprot:365192-Chlamydomonas_euryale.AAC.6
MYATCRMRCGISSFGLIPAASGIWESTILTLNDRMPCSMRHTPCAMQGAPCVARHASHAMRHASHAMRRTPCAMRHAPCV